MTDKDKAILARHEKLQKADEKRYARTKQGKFEKSIKPCLVRPDGTDREINDAGRAMQRMIRALDWPYHRARYIAAIRQFAARLQDGTLQSILWAVFKARDQREAIRLAGVSERTFFRGVAKIIKIASRPIKSGVRGTSRPQGVAVKVRKSRIIDMGGCVIGDVPTDPQKRTGGAWCGVRGAKRISPPHQASPTNERRRT